MANIDPNDIAELERLIDKYGVATLLCGMSLICSEKADRFCYYLNGQDARPWYSDRLGLDKAILSILTDSTD